MAAKSISTTVTIASSELNLHTAFTYEVWARVTGPGTGYGGSSCLIGHNTSSAGQGNGSIDYLATADSANFPGITANSLFSQGGAVTATQFPNSTGALGTNGTNGFHQLVFTRTDGSASGSAFYLDGVLQGTFQTDSASSDSADVTIGATSWGSSSSHITMFLNGDISIARIYGAALTGSQVIQNFDANGARFGFAVPEPGTLAILATGLFGLAVYAWRRRKYA